jgi:hypothetical protein
MSATIAHPASAGTIAHPVSFWASVVAIGTAVVALLIWFVVAMSVVRSSTGAGTGSTGQHSGTGNYNQLCVPAPSTRYC